MSNTVKIVSITAIVLVIVVFNFIMEKYTDKSIDNMETRLDELKQSLLEENYEQSKKQSEKLKANWDDYGEKFAYFMDHEEIEKLSKKVTIIDGNLKNQEYENALEDCIEAKFLLEHVKDKLKLKLSNVF